MEAIELHQKTSPFREPAESNEQQPARDAERMRRILGDRFVEHAFICPIFDAVDLMLGHPSKREISGLILGGKLGSGRSMASEAVVRRYPYKRAAGFGYPQMPVVRFSLTGAQDPKTLCSRVLDGFGDKYELGSGRNPERRVIRRINESKTQLLIADNAHDMFNLSEDRARDMQKALQYLVEEGARHAIYVSTPEGAAKLAAHDFVEEYFTYYELPTWKNDDAYEGMLELLEKSLPLNKPSRLSALGNRQHLLKLSGGSTKKIMQIIKNAAVLAIHSHGETITKELMDQAMRPLPTELTKKIILESGRG